MNLADVRLVPLRYPSDLHMANALELPLQMANQVTLHDLAVVEVELQFKIVGTHRLQYGQGMGLTGKEIARDVAGVDRLDQHLTPRLGGLAGSKSQVVQIGRLVRRAGLDIGVRRQQTRHGVNPGTIERLGIAQRLDYRVAKLPLTTRQAGKPTLARFPVAGRQVEQHLLQPCIAQGRTDHLGRVGIGEEILDTAEAGIGCRRKAVEEVMFREQHAEVGGQSYHARILFECRQSRGKRVSSSAT